MFQKTTSADDNWNPLQDCQQRIKHKLHFIENNTHLSNADIDLLNVIEGIIIMTIMSKLSYCCRLQAHLFLDILYF